MEDTIKIELLTPLTGNFTSRELERQWEEGEYEYDVYEGLPLEGADLSLYVLLSFKQCTIYIT